MNLTGVSLILMSERRMAFEVISKSISLYCSRPRSRQKLRQVSLIPAASFASLFGDVEAALVCRAGGEGAERVALDMRVVMIDSEPLRSDCVSFSLSPPTGLSLSVVLGAIQVYRPLTGK